MKFKETENIFKDIIDISNKYELSDIEFLGTLEMIKFLAATAAHKNAKGEK